MRKVLILHHARNFFEGLNAGKNIKHLQVWRDLTNPPDERTALSRVFVCVLRKQRTVPPTTPTASTDDSNTRKLTYQPPGDLAVKFCEHVVKLYTQFDDKNDQRDGHPLFAVHGLSGIGKTRFGQETLNLLKQGIKDTDHPDLNARLSSTKFIHMCFNGGGDGWNDIDNELSKAARKNPQSKSRTKGRVSKLIKGIPKAKTENSSSMAARLICCGLLGRSLLQVTARSQCREVLLHLLDKLGIRCPDVFEFIKSQEFDSVIVCVDEAQLLDVDAMKRMFKEIMNYRANGTASGAVDDDLFVILVTTCLGGSKFESMGRKLEAPTKWKIEKQYVPPLTTAQMIHFLIEVTDSPLLKQFPTHPQVLACLQLLGGCPRLALNSRSPLRMRRSRFVTKLAEDATVTRSENFDSNLITKLTTDWRGAILAEASRLLTYTHLSTDAKRKLAYQCLSGIPVPRTARYDRDRRHSTTLGQMETNGFVHVYPIELNFPISLRRVWLPPAHLACLVSEDDEPRCLLDNSYEHQSIELDFEEAVARSLQLRLFALYDLEKTQAALAELFPAPWCSKKLSLMHIKFKFQGLIADTPVNDTQQFVPLGPCGALTDLNLVTAQLQSRSCDSIWSE